MSAVANVVLPIFAIILTGYLAGRFRLLGFAASDALNQYVYWIALPPLLFLGTARRPLGELLHWPFIGAFLGGMLIIYVTALVFGWLLHRSRPEALCLQGLGASSPNTGYLGIPLFLTAFGPAHVTPAVVATVIVGLAMVGLAVIVLEFTVNLRRGVLRALGNIAVALAGNPLILAPLLGVAWSVWASPHVALPKPVITFGELLGASSGPCALFAIGLFLAGRPFRIDFGQVGWVVALKLLWHPMVTWLLIRWFFPLDPYWAASAVILAALPTGALTFGVAERYDVHVERSSSVVLVSTALSLVTLSLLLAAYASVP